MVGFGIGKTLCLVLTTDMSAELKNCDWCKLNGDKPSTLHLRLLLASCLHLIL